IGNTIFRFEHTPSTAEPVALGWGQRATDDDDEIATTAGRASSRGGSGAASSGAASSGAASAAATSNADAARAPTALDASRLGARPTLPRPKPSGTNPPPPSLGASARLALPALPPGATALGSSDDGIPMILDSGASSSASAYPFTIPMENSVS